MFCFFIKIVVVAVRVEHCFAVKMLISELSHISAAIYRYCF